MTSSTSLYPQPTGNANVASRNFTTLYSGSGEIIVQEPGQYGNANVVGLLSIGTDGGNTVGNISATGNVTANYFIGNGSQLTGVVGSYGNANVTTLLANLGSNAISTTGNVTAGYFAGNGSQLTGIVSSYGNANVSAYLASGTNTADMVTTGNIIGGNLKTSGASGNIVGVNYVSANFYLGDGGLLSNITSSYGNANVSAYLASGTNTANILTTGNISATGNVTGNFILGNGSQLTGLPATYGNANVVTLLSAFGSNSISTTGNVTAGYFAGNGSLLSNITGANVTGVVANATFATTAGSATTAATVTGNAQANITSVGTLTSLSVAGTVTSGNIVNNGTISSTGNVTAPYFIGNIIGNITGNVDAAGSNTQVQFNDTGDILGATAGFTFDKTANLVTVVGNVQAGNLRTAGLVSATGNITGSAIFTTGNSIVGNLDINLVNSGTQGIQIAPDNSTLTSNVAGAQPGRITVGTGQSGNVIAGALNIETIGATRLVAYDSVTLPQSQTNPTRVASMAGQLNVDLGGSTWTNKRASGYRSDLILGNGNVSATSYTNLRAAAFNSIVGAYTDTNSVTQGASANVIVMSGVTSGAQVGPNSSIGNAISFISIGTVSLGNASNVSTANNQIGFASSSLWLGNGAATANTVIHYYAPGTSNPYGLPNMQTPARSAANYYFLKNDDAVAQTQLGTLRSYNEFNYTQPTGAGALTFNKNDAQVQQVYLTGNVTSVAYTNMVTNLSDGVNTDQEIDTLTLIFVQDATGGYDITFPTGSTYKYAGNVTALTSTAANSVSVVTVQAVGISGTANYLTTINPAFV